MRRTADRICLRGKWERTPIWTLLILEGPRLMRFPSNNSINIGPVLSHRSFSPMQMSGMKERPIIDMSWDLFKKRIRRRGMLPRVSIIGESESWLSSFRDTTKGTRALLSQRDLWGFRGRRMRGEKRRNSRILGRLKSSSFWRRRWRGTKKRNHMRFRVVIMLLGMVTMQRMMLRVNWCARSAKRTLSLSLNWPIILSLKVISKERSRFWGKLLLSRSDRWLRRWRIWLFSRLRVMLSRCRFPKMRMLLSSQSHSKRYTNNSLVIWSRN